MIVDAAVQGSAELSDRTIASRPLEVRVSDTSVEFQRVHQDRNALMGLARGTGGFYVGDGDVAELAGRISFDPRTTQTVTEVTVRTSLLLFLFILALLSAEWLIRKRAGMI